MRNNPMRRRSCGMRFRASISLSVMSISIWSSSAIAQETEAAEGEGDIVVTATRRDDRLIDVPASIQAFDESTLRQIGASGIQDIINKISGVSGFSTGNGRSRFNIRGVESISGSVIDASTVGYYVDETPIANAAITPDVALADIERVEVLKGPQGTLYGEGSLGGTIKLVTNKPDFDGFASTFTGELSQTRRGDINYQGSAVLNAPLSDKVAFRVVGSYIDQAGFIDDAIGGKADVNDARTWNVRASLRAAPTENIDVLLAFTHQDSRGGADTIEGTALEFQLRQAFEQEYRDRFNLGALTINVDLGSAELVSATSYYDRRRRELVDERDSTQALIDATGLPFPSGLRENTISPEKTFTQEVRLVSTGDGPLAWLIGGYYKNRKVGLFSTSVSPDLAEIDPSLGQIFSIDVATRFTEIAGFGEVSLRLTDALKLTGGARIFEQRNKGTTAVSLIQLDENGNLIIGGTGNQPIQQRNDDILFKASLDYKPSTDTTIYALFAQGIRAGGVNTRLFTPLIPRTYGSDSIDSFEIGAKAKAFGGLVAFDAAIYQLNWKDIQVPIVETEGIDYIVNAGKARTRGLEAGLTINPDGQFSLGGTFSLVDATIRETLLLEPASGGAGIAIPKGSRVPLTSKYKFNVFGTANIPLSDNLALTSRLDIQYVGKRNDGLDVQVGGVNIPSDRLPAYTLVDLRTGIESGKFTGSIFVENLFDKKAIFDQISIADGALINRPRTIGVQATLGF